MGRKSQLINLGADLKTRAKLATIRIKDEFKAGQNLGTGFKLMRKLKPMEPHIDAGTCPYCTPRFNKIKADQDILDLPDGADQDATRIIGTKPELRRLVLEIIKCPYYNGDKKT